MFARFLAVFVFMVASPAMAAEPGPASNTAPADPKPAVAGTTTIIATGLGDRAFVEQMAGLDRMIAERPDAAELYFGRAFLSMPRLVIEQPETTELFQLGTERPARPTASAVMADLDRAIELKPAAIVHRMRAVLHTRLNDLSAALADFEAAVRLSPGEGINRYLRGNLYLTLGKIAEARADMAEGSRLEPSNLDFAVLEIRIIEQEGRRALALRMLNDLLAETPAHPKALAARARMHVRDKAYAKALADYDAMARTAGTDRDYLAAEMMGAARAAEQAGDHRAALDILDQLVRRQRNNATALNNRCWLKATRNLKARTALADCERALDLRPGQPASYLDSRGFALLRAGRYAQAVRAYDKALQASPNMPTSLYGRGLARRRMGDIGGDRDIAAAKAKDGRVEAEFARYGITP